VGEILSRRDTRHSHELHEEQFVEKYCILFHHYCPWLVSKKLSVKSKCTEKGSGNKKRICRRQLAFVMSVVMGALSKQNTMAACRPAKMTITVKAKKDEKVY
jgi:hypothetical protein